MLHVLSDSTLGVYTGMMSMLLNFMFCTCRHSVHELFGFDIMLDRHLKPWVLEVNISPSLHSNSQLDVNIKGRMVRDLFNITGFYLPTREQITGE